MSTPDGLDWQPPPSWPAPPAGFRPAHGWTPDAAWPPAPPGWVFWRDRHGNPAGIDAGRPQHATVDPVADRSGLHRKCNVELDANLADGEPVSVVILGSSNQAVIGTDRRAFIYKKGFMAGATFGAEMTSWDYRNLAGVQIHTGTLTGAVLLQAPGQPGTKTSAWGQGNNDTYKAPNAIPIARPYYPAKTGVAKLRILIETAHRGARAAVPAPASSLLDQLGKLAQLHASGAITSEEFAMMKARLLQQP